MSSFKDLEQYLTKVKNSIKDMNVAALGAQLVENIKERTKKGIDATGKQFKPIKPATMREKKSLQKRGRLSSDTTPDKSNLIRTGEMVESTKSTIIKKETSQTIIISPTGSDNQKKASDNKKLGREYVGITASDEKLIKEYIISEITKILKG